VYKVQFSTIFLRNFYALMDLSQKTVPRPRKTCTNVFGPLIASGFAVLLWQHQNNHNLSRAIVKSCPHYKYSIAVRHILLRWTRSWKALPLVSAHPVTTFSEILIILFHAPTIQLFFLFFLTITHPFYFPQHLPSSCRVIQCLTHT